MKPVTFENRVSHERVICDDIKNVQLIDGIEFLLVHRQGQQRIFLMRKDSLEKVAEKRKFDKL
jgi:penicillin-binding protein-related factor A (putative recombinase)